VTPARAFWVVAPGKGELRTEPLPEIGAGQAQVSTLFSAVSRGTEALVFHGRVPKSEYERMRAPHQAGEFPGPVKYGYANVGRVVKGSAALEGRLVFCLYPHQTDFVVAESALSPVPEDVPPQRAVLAANMETALNALWDARPLMGDRITVVGAGVVGCLVAYLSARLPASHVELVDSNPARAGVASALGARFAEPGAAASERDLVFHASGSEVGLETALALGGTDAALMELSWYGDRRVSLGLGGAVHVKRWKLCASEVGTLSPRARRRYGFRERLGLALSLCADPVLDVLFEKDATLSMLPELMPRIVKVTDTGSRS